MAKNIGQLLIQMGYDLAQMKADSAEAKRINQEACNAIKDAWGSITGAVAITGLGLSVREIAVEFLNLAEEMRQMSIEAQKVGVTVDQYETFSYALQMAGGNAEKAQTALGMLDRQISQAAAGSKVAQEHFTDLGIAYKNVDGTVRDAYQIMRDLADVFASHADGATKTAWALALFGRSGKELIPVLNEGSAVLDEMDKHLTDLGDRISEQEQKHVKDFEQSWIDLKKAIHGAAMEVEDTALPAMTKLNKFLTESVTGHAQSKRTLDLWAGMLQGLSMAGAAPGFGGMGPATLPPTSMPGFGPQVQSSMIDEIAKMAQAGMGKFSVGDIGLPQMPAISTASGNQRSELDRLVESLEKQKAALEGNADAWEKEALAKANALKPDPTELAKGLALVGQIESIKELRQYYEDLDEAEKLEAETTAKRQRQAEQVTQYVIAMSKDEATAKGQLVDKSYEATRAREREALSAQMLGNYIREAGKLEGDSLQAAGDAFTRHYNLMMHGFDDETAKAHTWAQGWVDAFAKFKDAANDNAAHAGKIFDDMTKGMEDALVTFVQTGKLDFSQLANSIIADLVRISVEKQIVGMFGTGGFLNGWFGIGQGQSPAPITDLSTPAAGSSLAWAAGGGDISGPTIVGEKGPELFIPRGAGSIVPNDKLGVHIVNAPTINIDSRTDSGQIGGIVNSAMAASEQRIYESMRRKGAFANR